MVPRQATEATVIVTVVLDQEGIERASLERQIEIK
jgi:hypothetical protein